MFISAILWTIAICIVGLSIYTIYENKRDKKRDKEDLY